MSYTKLFSSIVTSTIWTEDDKTRIVWITMLAIADKNGEVQASIPGLARVASVSIEDTEKAIAKFMAPDKYSRTPDDEGRRIEAIDGGWRLLNHAKYRRMASRDEAQEANARRQAAYRERQRRNGGVTASNDTVTKCNGKVTHDMHIAEAEAEAEAERTRKSLTLPVNGARKAMKPPTIEQAISAGSGFGVTEAACREWWNSRESTGWTIASGGTVRLITNWQTDLSRSKGWAEEQAVKNKKADKTKWTPNL